MLPKACVELEIQLRKLKIQGIVQDSLCAISVLNSKFYIELDTYTTSPPISACVLKQKYLENRLSMRDIAREFFCSKTYVRSLLLRYGIPLRRSNKYHKDHWRIYGKRRAKGKAVDHQREIRTIAAIKKMYSEGMGITAIAKTLSTMQIPTKRHERESDRQASMNEVNGKGWDHSTVTAILRREGVVGGWREVNVTQRSHPQQRQSSTRNRHGD